jgi:uncharacterized protein involved in response to NO
MTGAGLVRVLPELGFAQAAFASHYSVSATLWSAAFALWLLGFIPVLRHPLLEADHCA